jgi:DNA-directed RNA polymerase subunit RPC12/RpoP
MELKCAKCGGELVEAAVEKRFMKCKSCNKFVSKRSLGLLKKVERDPEPVGDDTDVVAKKADAFGSSMKRGKGVRRKGKV